MKERENFMAFNLWLALDPGTDPSLLSLHYLCLQTEKNRAADKKHNKKLDENVLSVQNNINANVIIMYTIINPAFLFLLFLIFRLLSAKTWKYPFDNFLISKLELHMSITVAFKYLDIDMVCISMNWKEDRTKNPSPKALWIWSMCLGHFWNAIKS